MELHEVPNRSYVRVLPQIEDESKREVCDTAKDILGLDVSKDARVPPAAPIIKNGELIFFDHIDGMYSYCKRVNEDTMKHGELCHLVAWTQVEMVDIMEDKDFETIREEIGRSGKGKDGLGEWRQAALKDMSDEWVKASISFVPVDHPHKKYYEQELEYREKHNITIEDQG